MNSSRIWSRDRNAMDDCQKMAQNAINLASQATRILTIIDWEFRKALDAYPPQECDAAVKKGISECQLHMETAHHEDEKAGIPTPRVKEERETEVEPDSQGAGSKKTAPRDGQPSCSL
jgi:hypothetical protein